MLWAHLRYPDRHAAHLQVGLTRGGDPTDLAVVAGRQSFQPILQWHAAPQHDCMLQLRIPAAGPETLWTSGMGDEVEDLREAARYLFCVTSDRELCTMFNRSPVQIANSLEVLLVHGPLHAIFDALLPVAVTAAVIWSNAHTRHAASPLHRRPLPFTDM